MFIMSEESVESVTDVSDVSDLRCFRGSSQRFSDFRVSEVRSYRHLRGLRSCPETHTSLATSTITQAHIWVNRQCIGHNYTTIHAGILHIATHTADTREERREGGRRQM